MKLKDILNYMRRDSVFELFVYDKKTDSVCKKLVYDFETDIDYFARRGSTSLKKGEIDNYRDYYIMSIKAFSDCEPSLTFLICEDEEDIKKDSWFLMI